MLVGVGDIPADKVSERATLTIISSSWETERIEDGERVREGKNEIRKERKKAT